VKTGEHDHESAKEGDLGGEHDHESAKEGDLGG
jgi:hypothetical protein